MFAFSTSTYTGQTEIFRHEASADPTRYSVADARLEALWGPQGLNIEKDMHNARFDIGMTMSKLGKPLAEMRKHPIGETMALSHLCQNLHPSHKLDDLGWELFGRPKDYDAAVAPYKKAENSMMSCPEWICDKYQAEDAIRTMLIRRGLGKKVKELGLWPIYEMECQLVWTTLAIEERGVMLSRERCQALIDELDSDCENVLTQFQSIVGRGVPITDNSIRKLIYKDLGMPVTKRAKKGAPSVDKYVLMDLREKTKNPIFDLIMRFKAHRNGSSTIRGYLREADGDGIIHPNIHPYRADTSREACTRPNLQNVQTSERLLNPYPVPARKAFRPRPGYVNYDIDYSGVEMRGLVHYSQDPEFLRIFREGGDPHEEAAKEFLGERFNQATGKKRKSMRDASKNGDFALSYGGGVTALARCLDIPGDQVAAGYKRWKNRFSKMADLNRNDSAQVRKHGYVLTFYGRRLYVPRSKPYAGTNYKVQGGCAGILKRKQIEVEHYLNEATGAECGIILPIHDSLIIECPRKRMKDFEGDTLPALIKKMTTCEEMSVPLKVAVKVCTRDWDSLKKVEVAT